jgi:hypothetical protein
MTHTRPIDVTRAVCDALRRVDARLQGRDIALSSSIVDDLAFDSVRLVDLTLALEEFTTLCPFPMQEWIDEERGAAAPRFSVQSLIVECRRRLEGRNRDNGAVR